MVSAERVVQISGRGVRIGVIRKNGPSHRNIGLKKMVQVDKKLPWVETELALVEIGLSRADPSWMGPSRCVLIGIGRAELANVELASYGHGRTNVNQREPT